LHAQIKAYRDRNAKEQKVEVDALFEKKGLSGEARKAKQKESTLMQGKVRMSQGQVDICD
jgi:hypothetical protein